MSNIYTEGDYADEAQACAALDERLDPGLFNIYREVAGNPIAVLPGRRPQGYRIDRIISPTSKALAAGWSIGPVGVECKRSGVKVGKPIAQLLDYRSALFELPTGHCFALNWLFLWPVGALFNDLGAVCAQNRIGSVRLDRSGALLFMIANQAVATVSSTGIEMRHGVVAGTKAGSR